MHPGPRFLLEYSPLDSLLDSLLDSPLDSLVEKFWCLIFGKSGRRFLIRVLENLNEKQEWWNWKSFLKVTSRFQMKTVVCFFSWWFFFFSAASICSVQVIGRLRWDSDKRWRILWSSQAEIEMVSWVLATWDPGQRVLHGRILENNWIWRS